MEGKGVKPGDKVYIDFEPSMEWAWEDKWGTLILYLPGFNKQQLRVQVSSSGMLKLSGERPTGGERWNRFYKEVQIPKNCDTNSITAKFENNILYVQLPKINITTTPASDKQNTPRPPQNPAAANQQPHPQTQRDPANDGASKQQKPTDEPYTPRDDHNRMPMPMVNTSETTNPAETNKTAKDKEGTVDDHELGKDGKDVRGESYEQQGNNGGSTDQNVTKLDQEAPSVQCGSGSSVSTLENYTKVVGGLARDLRKGGKLFNFAVTVLVALLLGLYFGNIFKSSEKPAEI